MVLIFLTKCNDKEGKTVIFQRIAAELQNLDHHDKIIWLNIEKNY